MRRCAPPLRFLALVVGGWVCVRAALLAPELWIRPGTAATAPQGAAGAALVPQAGAPSLAALPPAPAFPPQPRLILLASVRPEARVASPTPTLALAVAAPPSFVPRASEPPPPAARPALAGPRLAPRGANRLSISAWLLVREEAGRTLAPGGTLGGSQAGLRATWRLNRDTARPLALSARLYAPLGRPAGAEAALGLDWRPLAAVPLHVLGERRQAIGRDGRSAFALALHGGAGARLPAGLRLDAYGQAGIVGLRSRDLYTDAAARIALPLDERIEVGAGLWGGAQPGAARLDAGPQLSLRLPVAGEQLRLSAEWRFRLAGDASPGSGPALTLGSDF